MKTLITLTEVALQGEKLLEIDVLLDPTEIAIIERGTQRTAPVVLVNTPNQTISVSIITFKSGRKLTVKENFDQIKTILANIPE